MRQATSASVATLKAVLEAFNAHDLDRIVSFFADDCVLEMPRRPDPWGTRYTGSAAVREGLRSRLVGIPDVQYTDDTHFVADCETAPNIDPPGVMLLLLGCRP